MYHYFLGVGVGRGEGTEIPEKITNHGLFLEPDGARVPKRAHAVPL